MPLILFTMPSSTRLTGEEMLCLMMGMRRMIWPPPLGGAPLLTMRNSKSPPPPLPWSSLRPERVLRRGRVTVRQVSTVGSVASLVMPLRVAVRGFLPHKERRESGSRK